MFGKMGGSTGDRNVRKTNVLVKVDTGHRMTGRNGRNALLRVYR